MSKFDVGDRVYMPGVPIDPVQVLEIATCDESPECSLGSEIFRFIDPGSGQFDWMHTSEFEKANV